MEVFFAFLRLGCLSFGGPIAHLGYFHSEFVERRRWYSAEEYAETVALAQSLPGPASSQVAFALGLYRAGGLGAMAAWVGFTMPSAVLIFAFACGHSLFEGRMGEGVLHGLQLVAVAVVAQAVLTMQRSLAPDAVRMVLAVVAAAMTLFVASSFTTVGIIAVSAVLGWMLPSQRQSGLRERSAERSPVSRTLGWASAAMFAGLLALPPIFSHSNVSAVFHAFYRTGALVFGGGHVVLPLLERAVVAPGWVDEPSFLVGYGMAQAVPGPLFTFAAYLGAVIRDPVTGTLPASLVARAGMSLLSLVAIFLPGLLLMLAVLPVWSRLRQRPRFTAALRMVNAAVVGVLFAALIRPVTSTAVHSWVDAIIALAAFVALMRLKAPPWSVVVGVVLSSVMVSLLRI